MLYQYANTGLLLWLSFLLFACTAKTGNDTPVVKKDSANAAIDSISNIIRQNPKDPFAYAGRAQLYFERNNFDAALADLQSAITLDSMQPPFYSLLTDVYLQYFKSWQGLRTMQKAAELFPQHLPTLQKLSTTQLMLKQHDESMKTIERIFNIDPQNADGFLTLGLNLKEMGDTARAINSFQKAVNFNADLIDAWINLGQLHESKGHNIAGKYYESAVQIAPDDVLTLHARADYYARMNLLQDALNDYKRIIEIQPDYEQAFFNSGLLYLDLDSVSLAFTQFDNTINISPLHVRAHYFRGYCAEMMGNKEQAKADYRKALSFSPDYSQAIQGLNRLGN